MRLALCWRKELMFVCLGRTWNGGHLHTDITFFMIRRSTRNSTGKVWRGEGGWEERGGRKDRVMEDYKC